MGSTVHGRAGQHAAGLALLGHDPGDGVLQRLHACALPPRPARPEDAGWKLRLPNHGAEHRRHDHGLPELVGPRIVVGRGSGEEGCYRDRRGVQGQGSERHAGTFCDRPALGRERPHVRELVRRRPLPRVPPHQALHRVRPGPGGDVRHQAHGLHRSGDEPKVLQRCGRPTHRLGALLPTDRGSHQGGGRRRDVRLQQGQRHLRVPQPRSVEA
mmetsp:Transcript_46754/g.106105  ORF Transcript_46754/g.106105 Transcript_46754/m.106105 type:complete len:213 (-) Transcript_46754:789-1427(-)